MALWTRFESVRRRPSLWGFVERLAKVVYIRICVDFGSRVFLEHADFLHCC